MENDNDQITEPKSGEPLPWRTFFDERQLKEIDFDVLYAEKFCHGTEGHNMRLIIAKMAGLLDVGDSR